MQFKIVLLASAILLAGSCKVSKNTNKQTTSASPSVKLDTVTVKPEIKEPAVYHATETRINDIIHTKLEVSFDWEKAHLLGKATITAKPYFYPVSTLTLDARGMDIADVSLVNADGSKKKLDYTYDSKAIVITLDKTYTRNDTYKVFIQYTAKPNELEVGGSAAISEDKGLYFINNDGKDKEKPQQIWTQGETQANSAWFPTIDRPNERMTEEIYITVEKKYTTLSNGELVSQVQNADGTRTDYWKMSLPHAPYLVMMAIGEYAVVKDKWRGKEVSYFVEKKYEADAKAIFGNTPEMLEVFSNKLGVEYPWNKYSQVVARDYVSGAMENTTATLHGEFVQRTKRELMDNDYEDVISHELFHQWFGDLVTTESWSNLPLNESFATYGEYIWQEHKYGRESADDHLQGDLETYLREARNKQVTMIRFNYEDREDMFDSHSYAKGGRILHMLRKAIGDDAFYSSLKLYLETHKFSPVEIHDLRLAFEKVTGQDLNWFFNQWFMASGHPDLDIKYSYDATAKKAKIKVTQKQNLNTTPLYRLPVIVDIYTGGKKESKNIVVTRAEEEFSFDAAEKPSLINFDAEKMLLCVKKENKTVAEYAFQYKNAPLFLDRYEALEVLGRQMEKDSLAKKTLISGLSDKFWGLREYAISKLGTSTDPMVKEKLMEIANKDPKTRVRAAAIGMLSKNFSGNDLLPMLNAAINDSSYNVMAEGLEAMAKIDKQQGLAAAKKFEKEDNGNIIMGVANVYAIYGGEEENKYFIEKADKVKGFSKIGFIVLYGQYLQNASDETINNALPIFVDAAKSESSRYLAYYGQKSLTDLAAMYKKREEKANQKIKDAKSANNPTELQKAEAELTQVKAQKQKLDELVASLKK
jgi:aminopeptidase N